MRHSKQLLLALSLGFLTATCSEDSVPTNQVDEANLIPLNICGSIDQQQSKATADGFVDKDALGLYAVNYTGNNTLPGTLVEEGNQADNVKYVFDEPNHKWNPMKKVYYKDVNTHVDIYLYYPYQANISSIEAANFEVQKDQSSEATVSTLSGYEASDFLWGKSADVTPTEGSVGVKLSHKLSAVQLTLTEGTGFGDGEFANLQKSVILTNTSRKATINYATGAATKVGEAQADGIVMCTQDNDQFRAVVIPQSVAADTRLFAITIDGIAYGFKQNTATDYLTGKQLNVDISINKKSPSGTYELQLADTQITDWTEDKNTHGGEARQYYVVHVETMGTLGKMIKDAGKNPDKIRNLKVTGQISHRDYYFMRDSMAILESVNLKEMETYGGEKEITNVSTSSPNLNNLIGQYGLPDRQISSRYYWYEKERGVIPVEAFANKKSLCNFVFPEYVTVIGQSTFYGTTLSGALIIPEDVTVIGASAFYKTSISSVTFNSKLKEIQSYAFETCLSLSGSLVFPESLETIGTEAFRNCRLSGRLILPDNLLEIGRSAFQNAGSFTEGLKIPDKTTKLKGDTFSDCGFTGQLNLNNVTNLESGEFGGCHFTGDLVIPNGTIEIPSACFSGNNFSKVLFPESLRTIGGSTFRGNQRLQSIEFNEGLISIESNAFENCGKLISLNLPESLQTIQSNAFSSCYYISNITCNAVEPPTIQSGCFNGVAKDNFNVEVPAQSVKRYQAESGWSDFKRITAHYDFSVSRQQMRALNASLAKTYTLRCPAGFDWSIQSKPDWVTVTPDHGTGKTDVTISVSEMARTNDTFEVNEGSFNSPSYKNYKGRSGELVFLLDEKEHTCSMDIEQYDYDYADGDVMTYHTATTGPGIDIVLIGDGYDAKDIAKGTFLANAEAGYGHFFDVEPYKSYKEYFNVKAVVGMSDDSGIGTVSTIKNTKFGSSFSQNRILSPNATDCFAWAMKANASMNLQQSLVIMMMNTSAYEGVALMYGDGSAIACCPVSTDAYPYDYRGIVQHEAGGHGFGKLGDEYIYHNAFVQNCTCIDGCDHPQSDSDTGSSYGNMKALGWFKNLSMSSDPSRVPWAHLLYHSQYSDYVDIYEGGYMHSRGMYRSEATSCMNNNIPYYSTISRQAIVERIKAYAGETFTLADFYAKDKDDFGPTSKGTGNDRTSGVDPKWNRGSEQGSIIYMGEHPDFSKTK